MTGTVLENTDASRIAAGLLQARRAAGSPAMGMVLTLVIVVPDDQSEEALKAALEAAKEHPSRLLVVILGKARGSSEISAEIRAGHGSAGELALIRLSGEVAQHPESVVLPLLLPDSPVVVWWPTKAPIAPAEDPLGRLATRRITDAAEVPTGRAKAMLAQCASYEPGNTDLAWTRITGWRALLAAALDQVDGKVTGISVTAQRISPSADLLGGWLVDRLKAPLTRKSVEGVGIHEVVLTTSAGDIRIVREDDREGTLMVPGQPDRPVALRRRTLPELLTEELRRLDPDDVYAATARRLQKMSTPPAKATRGKATKSAPRKSSAKRSDRAGARRKD
jgi:glucose-6-phosphate dehydrogenase assembly protein OpcA